MADVADVSLVQPSHPTKTNYTRLKITQITKSTKQREWRGAKNTAQWADQSVGHNRWHKWCESVRHYKELTRVS